MIIRCAYLEGTVAEADRADFDRRMIEQVLPAVREYPGLRDVKLRRLVDAEESGAPVYMAFDLYFDNLEAMRAALASEARQIIRRKIAAAMGSFDGRVRHLVFEDISR